MNVFDLAARIVEALETENVPYMIVGSLSSSVWGIPRSTKDVDAVLSLSSYEPLTRLEKRLSGVVTFDPQVSFETITGSRRHILTSLGSPAITVELFELGDDPFIQERFRRRSLTYSGQLKREIWLPTAEDVVIQKVRWGRDKDLIDVKDVIAVQTTAILDMAYIERWCAEHGTTQRLHDIIASLPPGI